MLSIRDFP